MVLNVVDEIINGSPKYNITPNGDGTSNITLANEVVEQGTALNKQIFNKIENTLSYLTPQIEESSIEKTYTGNILYENSLNRNWSNTEVTINKPITGKLTTYDGITPIIEFNTTSNSFYSYDSSSTSTCIYPKTGWNQWSSMAFTENLKNTSFSTTSYGWNRFYLPYDKNLYITYDFYLLTKPTFNYILEKALIYQLLSIVTTILIELNILIL